MISLERTYEQLKTKYMKAAADIVFTKTFRIENLMSTWLKKHVS